MTANAHISLSTHYRRAAQPKLNKEKKKGVFKEEVIVLRVRADLTVPKP